MREPRESYDPRYFEPLFAAEEKHFWFVARNKLISAMVRKAFVDLKEPARILEVGCGTGNVLRELVKEFPQAAVVGMDLFHEGLRFAKQRVSCPLIQADLALPPFSSPFDLVGLFDVLEHIKEDQGVLRQVFQLVKPGGWLLITVPANPNLWSYFDIASHHERRYTRELLISRVISSGFSVDFVSHYFAATFPLVWLNRRIMGNTPDIENNSVHQDAESELRIIPVINDILREILGLEAAWLSRGKHLPFGSSLVLLARKPVTSH